MIGTEIIYQQAHLSDFTIKTLLKTMRKKKNFKKRKRKTISIRIEQK